VELTNVFSVKVPIDDAWAVLTDLERIAPCMPGFELQEVDGEEYRGVLRVRVGPMAAQYKGVASFRERDEAKHRVIVRAEARETRGQGNASATITATLASADRGTHVIVHTDLKITGKVAQFGRGVLADVSSKLLGQFVQALEADVLGGAAIAETGPTGAIEAAAAGAPASTGQPRATQDARDEPNAPKLATGPRRIDSTSSQPVDLLAAAGSSVIKRVGPLIVVVVVVAAVLWLMR
jgi:carbon monoxide dehydrogenase subunit G